MDPHVGSSSLHDGAQLGSLFLLVPPELVDESTDKLTINIRIDKDQVCRASLIIDVVAKHGDLRLLIL